MNDTTLTALRVAGKLPTAYLNIIIELGGQPEDQPLTARDLQQRLEVDLPYIKRTLNAMEVEGLVTRGRRFVGPETQTETIWNLHTEFEHRVRAYSKVGQ